jgi:glycosyltransferase 2 family protein
MRDMAAPETAGARFGRHFHLSGAAKLGARIIISAALLALLITKIPADDVQPKDTHFGTLAFLAFGLAFTLAGFILSAWRWQRVFAVFDTHVPLRTLLAHYLAGQFVGNVLPSTIGGDVLRVSRASKSTGTGDVAFASVVIERLSGFVALPLLTVLGFAIEPTLLQLDRSWIALAIAGATVAGLVVILSVAASPKLAGRFATHRNWMRFIGSVHIGVDRIRREPRRAVSVLVAAIAYQASVLIAVWCAIHALGVSLPNGAVLAFLPAVACAQVLPISLSGLGIREGLLVVLLRPLGVPTGKAVGIGLLWYGMTLVVSLLGAPAFAVGQRGDRETDDDNRSSTVVTTPRSERSPTAAP